MTITQRRTPCHVVEDNGRDNVSGSVPGLLLGRFKPYLKYQESGVEWLPRLPAHWRSTKMWVVAKAISGGTPAKDDLRYWNGDIPWVTPKDMKRRWIDSSEDYISDVAVRETGLKTIQPPAVLIVVRGMILAHSFPVAVARVPVTINQDMKALIFPPDVCPEFMAYWLEAVGKTLLSVIVDDAAHGTKAIRMDRWRSTPVFVPPRREQRRIVAFLSEAVGRIDALIAKKERLAALLVERRDAFIRNAVTRGLDAAVAVRDPGVDGIAFVPVHWTTRKVTWLFRIGSGTTPPSTDDSHYGGDIPWVTTSELRENTIFATNRSVTAEAVRTLPSLKLHKKGSVVLAMYGATIGRLGVLGVDATVNQACCVFADPQGVDAEFWFYWLQMRRSFLISVAYGGGQPNLSLDLLRSMRVPLPPIEEQRMIVTSIRAEADKVDEILSRVRSAIQGLYNFRDALIFEVVSGTIDVREDVS